jgi:hypothetical protein
MPGRKERGQLELFITGSFLILGGFAPGCWVSIVRTTVAPVSIPRLLCA